MIFEENTLAQYGTIQADDLNTANEKVTISKKEYDEMCEKINKIPEAYLVTPGEKKVMNKEATKEFQTFLHELFALCKKHNYHLNNRVSVRDNKTGRVFK